MREGALCVKECCVKESGGSGGDGTVRGEGEWLARLVLSASVVNGETVRAIAGWMQDVTAT